MSKLPNTRKILSEDFPAEAKTVIDKLAFILNKFMQDVVGVINGNLDFDNFKHKKVSVELTVDATGIPVGNDLIQNSMTSSVIGITCIRAINTKTSTNYPTSTPLVSFDYNTKNQLRVKHVTNLTPDEKYVLTVILY